MILQFFGPSIIYYRVLLCVVVLMTFVGEGQFQSTIIGKIRQVFSIGQEENRTFKYLGLNIKQTTVCISID